jgi:hypothetical protein
MTDLPAEADLVKVWAAVLRLPDADGETSFLDHGGTSITAVRLRAKLTAELGLDIDVITVVDNPSPALLLNYLEDSAEASR